MADALFAEARELDLETLFLFGHCSGALIAYELAHRLRADRSWLEKVSLRLLISAQAPPMPSSAIRDPGVRATVDVAEYLRATGGTPDEVLNNSEMMALISPAVFADLVAVDHYHLPTDRPLLDIPLTVFSGDADRLLPDCVMEQWRSLCEGTFEKCVFESGHFYLRDQEDAVLRRIRHMLTT